jgi:hypothetical protein
MFTKLSESGKKVVNDQAVIRAMSPRDTVKWLARLVGIPLRTARFWAERTVPVYRRSELALLMIEEFHRQTEWREKVLFPALCQMAGLENETEILPPSSIARAAAHLVGATADRIEAAIEWIEE